MTTTAKAKELRKVADQMVTHAKIGNMIWMIMIWMMRRRRMMMKMNELT